MVWYDSLIPFLWATAFVMAWSLLYRENFAFRVAEHLTIGLFLAFTIYTGLDVIWKRVFLAYSDYSDGSITGIALISVYIVTILGVLTWTRLYEPTQWIARWPLAVLTGIGTGVAVRGAIEAQIVKQLDLPKWFVSGDLGESINNIIIAIGTLAVITYFLFTQKQEGPVYVASFIGRITMMIAFGTMLGLFVMSNIAFPVGQMLTLMKWPAIIVTILAALAVVYDIYGPGWPGPFAPKEE